jgi:hypothetical protein
MVVNFLANINVSEAFGSTRKAPGLTQGLYLLAFPDLT